MFFETVLLTSASEAGAHLIPVSITLASAALFIGWIMTTTGHYKFIDSITGIGPFFSNICISRMNQDSSSFTQWFCTAPQGLGIGIMLHISLIVLPASVDRSAMAVAAGFAQIWRNLGWSVLVLCYTYEGNNFFIGQVSGVAIASAIFQSILARELKTRIIGPGSEEIIYQIRHSSKVVSLPPEIQLPAREAYGCSQVFKIPEISLNDSHPSRTNPNDQSGNTGRPPLQDIER
ncbi:hypothetical protein Clacol_009713 [Clathrus columnatus]|uniref:Uncharacterized protein n=1 Tax=Clathrus columnatus TaxID=1419009 RepID=A0AAV5ALV7_9AGAM|nr:hypothetical protein Clacol_009713 [Clathrus columnatus]